MLKPHTAKLGHLYLLFIQKPTHFFQSCNWNLLILPHFQSTYILSTGLSPDVTKPILERKHKEVAIFWIVCITGGWIWVIWFWTFVTFWFVLSGRVRAKNPFCPMFIGWSQVASTAFDKSFVLSRKLKLLKTKQNLKANRPWAIRTTCVRPFSTFLLVTNCCQLWLTILGCWKMVISSQKCESTCNGVE